MNSKKGATMKKRRFAKVRTFINENKKPLLIIGGILATSALAILSYIVSGQGDSEPNDSIRLDSLSEEELREIECKMRSDLERMDYNSDEYGRLYEDHCDVVSKISSRFSGSLPKRENGWYLPNDD